MSVPHEWRNCVWKTQIAPQQPSTPSTFILLYTPILTTKSHNQQALSMWKVCTLYKLQVLVDLTTDEAWSFSWSPLRRNADFWILSSLFSILFCRDDEKKKKKREWEAEMKSNTAIGSLPPLQVRLSIAGKGGSAPRPARVRRHGLEKHPEPRSVNSTSGAQSSERNQYGERETDSGSPNLALSLQARWPPTHTVIYADTHTNTYWHTAMLSFAQSHTYTCMCLCVWFSSRPCYCGETSTIQTFFSEVQRSSLCVSPTFAPLRYLCPSMSPSTSVWWEKSFRYIKYLQGWTSSPEQLIAYSVARLERGKQLYYIPLCSTTLHQKLTLPQP